MPVNQLVQCAIIILHAVQDVHIRRIGLQLRNVDRYRLQICQQGKKKEADKTVSDGFMLK